jgi:hypothetical protein
MDAKQTQQLMKDSVSTSDESPLAVGPTKERKKPRHPPSPPSDVPGVDFSNKSVILFPGQGFQFVGMGKKLLGIQYFFLYLNVCKRCCVYCSWFFVVGICFFLYLLTQLYNG